MTVDPLVQAFLSNEPTGYRSSWSLSVFVSAESKLRRSEANDASTCAHSQQERTDHEENRPPAQRLLILAAQPTYRKSFRRQKNSVCVQSLFNNSQSHLRRESRAFTQLEKLEVAQEGGCGSRRKMIPVLDPSLVAWYTAGYHDDGDYPGGGVSGSPSKRYRHGNSVQQPPLPHLAHKNSNLVLRDDDGNDDISNSNRRNQDDHAVGDFFHPQDDNDTADSTVDTTCSTTAMATATGSSGRGSGSGRRYHNTSAATRIPNGLSTTTMTMTTTTTTTTLLHLKHQQQQQHRSHDMTSTSSKRHQQHKQQQQQPFPPHSKNNKPKSHITTNMDMADLKKWRSPVCIRLKTLSGRRRLWLVVWGLVVWTMINLLSLAGRGEYFLEAFDVDINVQEWWNHMVLGRPIPEPVHICFVTAQYTSSIQKTDTLVNLRQESSRLFHKQLSSYFHFFAFTNQAELIETKATTAAADKKKENKKHKHNNNNMDADNGWTIVVHPFYNFRRFITQSRWPKFQGYKHPQLQEAQCQVVFYMDGTVLPRGSVQQFQAEARRILNSEVGLSQELHPLGGGVSGEMERCRQKKKDVPENLNATWSWLNDQPDFDDGCTLYQNTFFGYAVDSKAWTQAADFAWDRFSQELDSWRDQPLWCYTLHHFRTTPLIIPASLFEYQGNRRGQGKHTYGHEAATAAQDYRDRAAQRKRQRDHVRDEKHGQDALLRQALENRRFERREGLAPGELEAIVTESESGSGSNNEAEGRTNAHVDVQRERMELVKRNSLRQRATTTALNGHHGWRRKPGETISAARRIRVSDGGPANIELHKETASLITPGGGMTNQGPER